MNWLNIFQITLRGVVFCGALFICFGRWRAGRAGSLTDGINQYKETYNEAWKMDITDIFGQPGFGSENQIFVGFSRNLKKWNKFLCTIVVKLKKIGYTRVTNFLGCSITLLF